MSKTLEDKVEHATELLLEVKEALKKEDNSSKDTEQKATAFFMRLFVLTGTYFLSHHETEFGELEEKYDEGVVQDFLQGWVEMRRDCEQYDIDHNAISCKVASPLMETAGCQETLEEIRLDYIGRLKAFDNNNEEIILDDFEVEEKIKVSFLAVAIIDIIAKVNWGVEKKNEFGFDILDSNQNPIYAVYESGDSFFISSYDDSEAPIYLEESIMIGSKVSFVDNIKDFIIKEQEILKDQVCDTHGPMIEQRLPKGQIDVILRALEAYGDVLLDHSQDQLEKDGTQHDVFDMASLKTLLQRGDVTINLPKNVKDSFINLSGVDYPEYVGAENQPKELEADAYRCALEVLEGIGEELMTLPYMDRVNAAFVDELPTLKSGLSTTDFINDVMHQNDTVMSEGDEFETKVYSALEFLLTERGYIGDNAKKIEDGNQGTTN